MIAPSISVADMIAALSALPAGARVVMTHSGYYCYSAFADIYMPVPVNANGNPCSVNDAVAESIGHSHQDY